MIVRVRVRSHTNPRRTYLVTAVNNLPVACTCPAFEHFGTDPKYACKHMSEVVHRHRPLTEDDLRAARQLLEDM